MYKKLIGSLLVAVTALFSAASWAQVIGYVHEIKGVVAMREAGKQPARAEVGSTFAQGTAFVTAANSEASIRFEDGQIVVLAPNTTFVATTYVFNKAKVADSNIALNLVRGGMRFVSGMIATTNREKFVIKTPTATAGVRGTEGTIVFSDPDDPNDASYAPQGQQRQGFFERLDLILGDINLARSPGLRAAVAASSTSGQITLTAGGTTVTIPAGSSSFSVAGSSASLPIPTATAPIPAVLQQVVTLARAIALANPANTPVNVAAVANAVRAAAALSANTNPAQTAALLAAAQAALQAAVTANQAVLLQAIAGGGVAATPGSGTPGALPLTLEEQQIIKTLLPPTLPSGS